MSKLLILILQPRRWRQYLPPKRRLTFNELHGVIHFKVNNIFDFFPSACTTDRLCGLVVRVPGYRSRDPGFGVRRYQIFCEVVGLERGPLSLVSRIEELPEWKNRGSGFRKPRLTVVGIRCADQATPSIRKSWH
jgi:hypothetical protein